MRGTWCQANIPPLAAASRRSAALRESELRGIFSRYGELALVQILQVSWSQTRTPHSRILPTRLSIIPPSPRRIPPSALRLPRLLLLMMPLPQPLPFGLRLGSPSYSTLPARPLHSPLLRRTTLCATLPDIIPDMIPVIIPDMIPDMIPRHDPPT